MEKVLGIITEYNPFHNGHLYHLNESKKQTNCQYSICVMSGNFTQRGATSIIDKWSKAKMAIQNGIDLIIELPTLYAISSAENFAYGAIKILDSLNIVTDISFGTESNNIDLLDNIAHLLLTEPEEFKTFLNEELNKGSSFPKAREIACAKYLQKDSPENLLLYNNILSSPNNILGIEYLKALKKLNSNITPHVINRIESEHNSLDIKNNIASSSAIRNIISENQNLEILKKLMPENSYTMLMENFKNGHFVPDISCFEKEIFYRLRQMSTQDIANLAEVNEGLEYKIKTAANSCNNLNTFFDIVKSKRFTRTRLQRILLYSLLNITKEDMLLSKNASPYIHVLGFNTNGQNLLSQISKANPKLKIITSVKKFENTCTDLSLKNILEKDILATNIYTLAYTKDSFANLDYTTHLINI